MSLGYEKFDKHDDSVDEHIDSLLKTVINHEREEQKPIDAHVVTWRGVMTKAGARPEATYRKICSKRSAYRSQDHVGSFR